MSVEREKYRHPSYGQIRFARIQGHQRFYGSELEQDHYIQLEICQSSVEKDLSNDWYHAENELIQVRMTSNQFAEMITSLNHEGIPCTIEYLCGEKIDPLPNIENKKELTHRQFRERLDSLSEKLSNIRSEIYEITKKTKLSKDDLRRIQINSDILVQEVTSNIPFFGECFQEHMDKIVIEAKTEIEAAIQHKINMLGLTELHKQNQLFIKENNQE